MNQPARYLLDCPCGAWVAVEGFKVVECPRCRRRLCRRDPSRCRVRQRLVEREGVPEE